MSIYNGPFGAIDGSAYLEGQPSDTWLRRKIENNIKFLTIAEPPVTVLRKCGDSTPLDEGPTYYGDRAIASWATTVFICQPVWVTLSTSHIKMHLCIRSQPAIKTNTYTGPSAVFIGAIVKQSDGKEIGSLQATTFDDTRSYEEIGLTTFVIPVAPTGTGYVTVLMTIRSVVDDSIDAPAEKTQNTFALLENSGRVQFNFAGAVGKYDPATSPTSTYSVGFPFDHGMVENESTDDYGDVIAFEKISEEEGTNLYGLINTCEGPGLGSQLNVLGLRPLSYLQMRSYTVEVVHRYTLRIVELLGGVPERGIDNLRQAQSVRLLRSRPRMIAGGPEGYFPPFRHAVQGRHPQIWSSASSGTGSSPQPVTTLLQAGGIEPFSDGKVQIMLLLHGCAHNAKGFGTVEWELIATVNNWVANSTRTLVAPIATVGTRESWNQRRMATAWIPAIQRAVTAINNDYYAARDGQFLPSEFPDLTQVIMEIDVPSGGLGVGFNIVVTAECLGNIVDLSTGKDPIRYQQLTLVGHAVYLIPREAS